jgi:hypothetical protein
VSTSRTCDLMVNPFREGCSFQAGLWLQATTHAGTRHFDIVARHYAADAAASMGSPCTPEHFIGCRGFASATANTHTHKDMGRAQHTDQGRVTNAAAQLCVRNTPALSASCCTHHTHKGAAATVGLLGLGAAKPKAAVQRRAAVACHCQRQSSSEAGWLVRDGCESEGALLRQPIQVHTHQLCQPPHMRCVRTP